MQKIKVNLIPSGLPVACYSSQYDEGRVIRCELYNGLQPYTLQENDVVTLNLRKPDNHVVTATLSATAGNKYVDLVTSEQMTAVFGVNKCLLKITNTGLEVGTAEFVMFVQKDVIANGDPSESVIEGLQEMVDALVDADLGDNYYNKAQSDAFITDEYDATSTYAIGDMVIHENALYVCSTAITTAEAWNSAHWTLTDIATAIGNVKTAIPTKTSDLQNDSGFAQIDDTTESASKTYSSEKIEAVVGGVQSEVNKIENSTLILLSNKAFSEAGYIKSSDGTFVSASNNFSTPYIPVVAGDKFYIKSFVDNNRTQIAFYTNTSGAGFQAIATGNLTYKETTYTVASNGFVRFSMSYAEYYPPIFYYDGTMPTSIEKYIDTVNSKVGGQVDVLNSTIYGKVICPFEIGNITINSSGWTYSDSTKRIRTPNGYTLDLRAGDTIKVKSSTVRIYVGWNSYADGNYYSQGWITGVSTFTALADGKYVMTASLVPEAVLNSVNQVSDYIEIDRASAIDSKMTLVNTYSNVKGINHKGYCYVAPENTLPAYKLSKQMGFEYVETDISFTSDDIPVLLHDNTINRTARNLDGTEISSTIGIGSITYSQALNYDFGIWKSEAYAGTKIPKFEDFIKYCKYAGLKAYCEIKSSDITEARVVSCLDIVTKYGMDNSVTWISFSAVALGYVTSHRPNARVGLLASSLDATLIGYAHGLETGTNEVFFDLERTVATNENINTLISEGFPAEVYIIDTISHLEALNPYITGVTTNSINIPLFLYLYAETLI